MLLLSETLLASVMHGPQDPEQGGEESGGAEADPGARPGGLQPHALLLPRRVALGRASAHLGT